MKEDFCFWTVAPGELGHAAATMVDSARAAGVFKDIHVWADMDIANATRHAPGRFERWGGLYRFTYLRDAVLKLQYEYYVWLNPQTRFHRHPGSVLCALEGAPVHVPLTRDLTNPEAAEESLWGAPDNVLAQQMRSAGVHNRSIYGAHAGFFVVHREAAETLVQLAFDFWNRCDKEGIRLTCEPLLAYTAQMLAGDPCRHMMKNRPDLWLPETEISAGSGVAPAITCLLA